MTKKDAMIAGAAAAMVLIACSLLIGGLYDTTSGSGNMAFRTNRFTGEVMFCNVEIGKWHTCAVLQESLE